MAIEVKERKVFSYQERFDVYLKTWGICWYCGAGLIFMRSKDRPHLDVFTVDHVVPIIAGGTDDLENLVPACKACNSLKNTKSLEEFRAILAKRKEQRLFSHEQLLYLGRIGIRLEDIHAKRRHTFFFENHGFSFDEVQEHLYQIQSPLSLMLIKEQETTEVK